MSKTFLHSKNVKCIKSHYFLQTPFKNYHKNVVEYMISVGRSSFSSPFLLLYFRLVKVEEC